VIYLANNEIVANKLNESTIYTMCPRSIAICDMCEINLEYYVSCSKLIIVI